MCMLVKIFASLSSFASVEKCKFSLEKEDTFCDWEWYHLSIPLEHGETTPLCLKLFSGYKNFSKVSVYCSRTSYHLPVLHVHNHLGYNDLQH